MSKTISQIALAVLSASLAGLAGADGYRLDVAIPAAAEALYRPGVERAARAAFSQVVNDQFEQLYPKDQWWISINTSWSREAAGLRHFSSCALERGVPVHGSTATMDPVLWDFADGILNSDGENDQPLAAVWTGIMKSCGRVVRRAVRAQSVFASPQIEFPSAANAAHRRMIEPVVVDALTRASDEAFEQRYRAERWLIVVQPSWRVSDRGLDYYTTCSLEQRLPGSKLPATIDRDLYGISHGALAPDPLDRNLVVAAVHASVLQSCSELVAKVKVRRVAELTPNVSHAYAEGTHAAKFVSFLRAVGARSATAP